MGAGAVHGQNRAERPGTASLLKMEYAPALPSPDAHQASGVSFLAGIHSTFPAVIRSLGQLLFVAQKMIRNFSYFCVCPVDFLASDCFGNKLPCFNVNVSDQSTNPAIAVL